MSSSISGGQLRTTGSHPVANTPVHRLTFKVSRVPSSGRTAKAVLPVSVLRASTLSPLARTDRVRLPRPPYQHRPPADVLWRARPATRHATWQPVGTLPQQAPLDAYIVPPPRVEVVHI